MQPPPHRPRVLLVEDDADIREALFALLELEGYACVPVASAEAGLALLPEGDFDLVVTDYQLPEHTGAWLLSQAKARSLLGFGQGLIVTASERLEGAEGFPVLKKPIGAEAFLRAVRERIQATPRRRSSRMDAGWRSGLGSLVGRGAARAGLSICAVVALVIAFSAQRTGPEDGGEFQARGSAKALVHGTFGVRGFCVAPEPSPTLLAEVAPGGELRCPEGALLQLTYTATSPARLTIKLAGTQLRFYPVEGESILVESGVDVPLPVSTPVDGAWLQGVQRVEATFSDPGGEEQDVKTVFALRAE